MNQPAEVFELKRQGFSLRRGIGVLAVMLVPLIVLGVLHQEKYFLSVAFAALFVGLSDPGGDYGYRVPRMAAVGVAGALLTGLGFAIGDGAWGLGGPGRLRGHRAGRAGGEVRPAQIHRGPAA